MAPCKASPLRVTICTSVKSSAIRITQTLVKPPKNQRLGAHSKKLPTVETMLLRKERNKISAAKSRANRKALFAQMQNTIDELRLENAALQVQVNDLLLRTSSPVQPEPYICALDSSRLWIADKAAAMGGIYDDDLDPVPTFEEDPILPPTPPDIDVNDFTE